METPELKCVDLLEFLPEQNGRFRVAAVEGVWDDVLDGHETQTAVFLGFVEQQLGGFDVRRSVDQLRLAIVEAHAAGATRIRHARGDRSGPPSLLRHLEVMKGSGHGAERRQVLFDIRTQSFVQRRNLARSKTARGFRHGAVAAADQDC